MPREGEAIGGEQEPWPVFLPLATTVYIYGYTNAAYPQKIDAAFEDGTVLTMTGQGEGNKATTPASSKLTTPADAKNDRYETNVSIYSEQGGKWVASQLNGAGCNTGLSAATFLVASEDWKDADWNDAVIQFLWYNPPPIRNAALAAREELIAEARRVEANGARS